MEEAARDQLHRALAESEQHYAEMDKATGNAVPVHWPRSAAAEVAVWRWVWLGIGSWLRGFEGIESLGSEGKLRL